VSGGCQVGGIKVTAGFPAAQPAAKEQGVDGASESCTWALHHRAFRQRSGQPTLGQHVLEKLRRRLPRTSVDRGNDPAEQTVEAGARQPRAHVRLLRDTGIRPKANGTARCGNTSETPGITWIGRTSRGISRSRFSSMTVCPQSKAIAFSSIAHDFLTSLAIWAWPAHPGTLVGEHGH
jgi:hypothetical protein